jgi:TonB family protein
MKVPKVCRWPLLILLALYAAGSAAPASARQASPSLAGPLITDPTWTRRPVLSIRNLRTPANIPGVSVDLECRVYPSGDLRNCVVLLESLPDVGLADAALHAVQRGRVSPETVHRIEPDGRLAFRLFAMLPGR